MSAFATAWSDLSEGFGRYRLWWALASLDIRHRYRRSLLGPFWVTLSLAITIGALGPLYSTLFGSPLAAYLPKLAAGLVFWTFISALITESTQAFVSATLQLRQMSMPLTMYVLQVYARQVLILAHNTVVLALVLLVQVEQLSLATAWLFLPGFALVSLTLIGLGICLAVFCTRYHDMTQIVNSLMMVLFFFSPIVWDPAQLPATRQGFVDWNPVAQWLEVLRQPILGLFPSPRAWMMTALSAAVASGLAIYSLGRARHRVAYWL